MTGSEELPRFIGPPKLPRAGRPLEDDPIIKHRTRVKPLGVTRTDSRRD